jgi:hypothetical protein
MTDYQRAQQILSPMRPMSRCATIGSRRSWEIFCLKHSLTLSDAEWLQLRAEFQC